MFKKVVSTVIVYAIAFSLFSFTSSANPSTYWCMTHKKTGCTHCSSHSMQNVGTQTANCTEGGGQIRYCKASGCGATFFQNTPLGHLNSNNVCLRYVSCGKVNTSDSSHFQYYMYRAGNHARNIPVKGGWLGYTNHRAIDIVNSGSTSISGFPIYAQGSGTVAVVGGRSSYNSGFYVVIYYDNGYVVRYLHVADAGRISEGSRVTSKTRIAYTSNTGTPDEGGTYGYHLHYDVIHKNNVNSDYSNLSMSNTNNINPNNLFPSGTFKQNT